MPQTAKCAGIASSHTRQFPYFTQLEFFPEIVKVGSIVNSPTDDNRLREV